MKKYIHWVLCRLFPHGYVKNNKFICKTCGRGLTWGEQDEPR